MARRSTIAVETPGWRGATKAHIPGMQPRNNEANRAAAAARSVDLARRGPLVLLVRPFLADQSVSAGRRMQLDALHSYSTHADVFGSHRPESQSRQSRHCTQRPTS